MAERSSTPRARRGGESGSGISTTPVGGAADAQQNTTAGVSSQTPSGPTRGTDAAWSSGSGLGARMRQQANERLSSQKDHALEGLGGVTQAVRTTTQSLREQQHDTIARYVEQAADQVDRLADTLRNKDVAELIADAQRLARRQPAVFVGSAFAVGLLAARFLKSSSTGSAGTGGYDYREYRSPSTAAMSASRTT